MKIAILSDIHGNHIALKAVLEEAESLGVEYLIVLGDIVGYYYHPEIVMELIASWSTSIIQGNHERLMLEAINDATVREKIEQKYGKGITHAIFKLSEEQKNYLISLPTNRKLVIDDIALEIYHGSPWDPDIYIYPDNKKNLQDACIATDANFVFCGHTHRPFVYSFDNTLLVNVGSVGQPRDSSGLASWAFLDTANRSIIFKHTCFDVSQILKEVHEFDDGKPILIHGLLRNRNL